MSHSQHPALSDVFVKVDVDEELDAAVDVVISTTFAPSQALSATVEISSDGQTVCEKMISIAELEETAHFSLNKPTLWYPRRYGNQSLHTVTVTLKDDSGAVLDTATKQVGFRRAELVQHALVDQPGKSFFFRVNNIDIFAAGSNWIPAHSFESLLTESDYKDWVKVVVDGNQDMLRIWGGGFYEDDMLLAECVSRCLVD